MKVRIIKAGDGKWPLNSIVPLEEYLDMVKGVLENGGEIPIAILWIRGAK